jgi:hypothetical protein
MSDTFTLLDTFALGDLRTYLGRAGRIEDGSARLIAGGGVLAAYTATLYPAGLLDESPTVLGLRTFAMPLQESFDVVVPLTSLARRLDSAEAAVEDAAANVTVSIPMQVHSATWAAITPPRGGWESLGTIPTGLLADVAHAGIQEVAALVPDGSGLPIVQKVRSEVWSRSVPGYDSLPSGAAFAALTLGFFNEPDEIAPLYQSGAWMRLTTQRGHVLVKQRAWSLGR